MGVTFGGPRAGDAALAKRLDRALPRFYRVIHHADAVPHLPCCIPAKASHQRCSPSCNNTGCFAPWHAGQEIYYTDAVMKASPRICNGLPSGEDDTFSDSLGFWTIGLDDHLRYFGLQVSHICGVAGMTYQ